VAAYPPPQQIWPWPTADDKRITADLRADAEEHLRQAEHWLRRAYPDLRTETVLVCEYPAQALIEESRTAALMVVGSRRRHTLGSVMLGSVSLAVAAAAPATVIVTPAHRPKTTRRARVHGGLRTSGTGAAGLPYL
jgi:nucleotide-binding universal stress UspA family protein